MRVVWGADELLPTPAGHQGQAGAAKVLLAGWYALDVQPDPIKLKPSAEIVTPLPRMSSCVSIAVSVVGNALGLWFA